MSVDDKQDQGSPQLEQVLPILLPHGHLTAVERLACFSTSQGLAEQVLRHAACTHLELTLPAQPTAATATAATTATTGSRSGTIRSPSLLPNVAQQLAAPCDNVTLALHCDLLTPAACLWQCITTIQLHDIQLSQASISQMQLHQLPHLHTLSLQHCRMACSTGNSSNSCSSSSSNSSSGEQHRSTSIRTLECLNCADHELLCTAFEWVDPSQLQTVITDHASVTTLLQQLPALQELHIRRTPTGCGTIDDTGFQQLLAHPQLLRVQLDWVRLSHSHADQPCRWESLHLSRGVLLTSLSRMPLAGIQSCILHGYLVVDVLDSLVSAATSSISRAQHLVFQPSPKLAFMWMLPEHSFDVDFNEDVNSQMSAYAVTLALHCVPPDTALALHSLAIGSPEVQASLAAAPATMTTLCFCDCKSMGVQGVAIPGVLTHMPHVNHVLLQTDGDSPADPVVQAKLMEQLRSVIAGVTRPVQLTLVLRGSSYMKPSMQWQLPEREAMREWVHRHANKHVQVDFQCHGFINPSRIS